MRTMYTDSDTNIVLREMGNKKENIYSCIKF